jgi:hypothetical protein
MGPLKTRLAPTKLDWWLLAVLSFIVPICILSLRMKVMCPHLGVKAFEFMPLSGYVHGHSAHLFARIMHNLTHPILMFGYAVGLGYLALRPIRRNMTERSTKLFLCGLGAFHLLFIGSYLVTLFLPIGFGVEIRPN